MAKPKEKQAVITTNNNLFLQGKDPAPAGFFYLISNVMDKDQTRNSEESGKSSQQVINPFENNQSIEKDLEQSKEQLDNEQQFKEAMSERD